MRLRTLRGRPQLYTSYEADSALLNTPAKRGAVGVLLLVALLGPFLITDDVLLLLATAFIASIGAIGLNLVTGYAGQVSLGHAFFLGLGAYTAAVINGDPSDNVLGFGLGLWAWLPAAGVVAALAGLLVSPAAVRLRGLYLAIVTLGLVFLGEHLFREASFITGGVGVGRPAAQAELFGFRFDAAGALFSKSQKLYWFTLVLLVIAAVAGRNLARSKIGRAFSAVRDRDIAAEVIGVSLKRYKALAFTISSFYAGIAGALLFTTTNFVEPTTFNLLLSVQYIAMILIGGIATISGSILGALFITLLPRFTEELPRAFPFISSSLTASGGISIFDLQTILYGLLIIVFLIFEPRGLYGIWVRTRNYWKGWPFSY